jgi:hypothetical protein
VYVSVQLSKQEVVNELRRNESGLKIREGDGLAGKRERKGTRTVQYPGTLRRAR